MTVDQIILFTLIFFIFAFLIWGKIRYDLVALAALVIGAIIGVIPKENVFSGFGHPAVIIIALVLIVSQGLSRSGAVELISRGVVDSSRSLSSHIGIMAVVSAAMSSVMNNVAALALLMPIDLQASQRAERSPALTLMPISFASILGGMVTLIGTPPNIVISTFRADALGAPYSMFAFAPVGIVVATVGVLFVTLIGWRLIPAERRKHNIARELGDLKGYIGEVKPSESSDVVGKKLVDLEPAARENDVYLLGIIRRGKRLQNAGKNQEIKANDLIVVEGDPAAIDQFIGATGLEFSRAKKKKDEASGPDVLMEVVTPVGARIEGKSAMEVSLLYRKGVTLLAISRKGKRIYQRIRHERVKAGDLLLLTGAEDQIGDVVDWLGCLPLAQRGLEITQRKKAWLSVGIFGAAIAAAGFGWLYLPLALAVVAIAYVAIGVIPVSQIYKSIEWPVIVLVGAMIPIGGALESCGATALIADGIVKITQGLPTVAVLAILMIITMTLSDVLNNVATALIAAPIAIDIAVRLNANPDSFLMAVAVAASCAFLTPIGHKNNTIIMGPGGYKFGDYWRMGLPLEILVVVVSVPMIMVVWPL